MLGLRPGVRVRRMSMLLNLWLLVLHDDTAANSVSRVAWYAGLTYLVHIQSSSNNGVLAAEILEEIILSEVPLVVILTHEPSRNLLVNSAQERVLEGVKFTVLVEALHWVHFLVNVFRVLALVLIWIGLITQETSHVNREAEDFSDFVLDLMKPALNLNRLAWVLSKLNEASYASIGVLGCYSRTCSIDGLVEVGWDVGFHWRAILLVCTPPSSSIHSIAGCGTPSAF